ncbi:hypothetical protein N9V92_06780 [Luminiphilus sp.]|nr:hypothetical protein [Luminiphilus sp.]MDB2352877.1 hypothetical protein [Luminiphilus sp.]
MSVLVLLASILPWTFGGFLGYLLSAKFCVSRLFSAGLCSLASWLLFGATIVLLDRLGILSFRDLVGILIFGHVTIFVVTATTCLEKGTHKVTSSRFTQFRPVPVIVAVVLCLYLFIDLYHLFLVPLQAWDGLDFWAQHSYAFGVHAVDGHATSYAFEQRHPLTLSASMGYSAIFGALTNFDGWKLGWILPSLSGFLILIGLGRTLQFDIFSRSTSVLLLLTLPLLENHLLGPSYSEPVMVAISVGISAMICLGLATRANLWVLGGFLCLPAFMLIRNTGPFYAAVFLAGGALFLLLYSSKSVRFAVATVCMAFVLSLMSVCYVECSIESLNFSAAIGDGTITLGTKALSFGERSLDEVLWAEFVAYIVNSSYSVLLLVLAISCVSTLCWGGGGYGVPLKKSRAQAFLECSILIGGLGLLVSLFSEYGANHGFPDTDTGHSRFLLPILSIIPTLFGFLCENDRLKTAKVSIE